MGWCVRRDELSAILQQALSQFSEEVTRLHAAVKKDDTFAEQHGITEAARLKVDNAREALRIHRAEHNC